MIIVSDAHISESVGNQAEFFRMLKSLERNQEDLVFLGDIFDLWIALPRYERDIHRRFLSWCSGQKKARRIGFIEGNHEYFLADERHRYFAWSSDGPYREKSKGYYFCHGDQVNRRDKNYLRFRKLTKNRHTKSVLQKIAFGPVLVEWLKKYLKLTNTGFRHRLPLEEMEHFARSRFESGDHSVFVGHFHQVYHIKGPEGRNLYALPSWFKDGLITRFEERSGKINHDRWTVLLDQ